jgi:predicted kinase
MNRPRLILLVGIPGSGKTTYAKNYIEKVPDTIHLSSDTIRAELYGDESIQGNPAEVFSLMQKRAVEALNDGYDVLYDATNITRKDRACIIDICPKFAKIECRIIWAPIEECIKRDAVRGRTVGKEIIDRMLKKFQAPYYDEGIARIEIILPDDFNRDQYYIDVIQHMKVPHDNPHHTLDIYQHCQEAYEEVRCYSFDDDICMAALWHDIGKPYVKAFIDSKGNSCDIAHYYQHQCVGAWEVYGVAYNIPDIAWLISTHMDPFMNTKYYNNLPPYLKKDIDVLHKADLEAH